MILLLTGLAAQAKNYEINVGGVEVTSSNASYITGKDIKSGYATYDESSNTLTLYSITITRTTSGDYAVHNRDCSGLTIKCVGQCDLSTKAHTIHMDKSTTIEVTSGSVLNATLNYASSSNTAALYSKNNSDITLKGPGKINIWGYGSGSNYPSAIRGEGSNPYLYFSNSIQAYIYSHGYTIYNYKLFVYSGSDVQFGCYSGYNVFNTVSGLSLSGNEAICSPADAYLSNGSLYNGSTSLYITDNYGVILSSSNFTDANFRSYMRGLYPKQYLTKSELQNLTTLNVNNKSIWNMKGVEKLIYLQSLDCGNNQITSLDLSSNTALTSLICNNSSYLASLNVNSCTKLTYLDVSVQDLTSLNISNLSKLQTLYCYTNPNMTSLSLPSSSSSALQTVSCYETKLSSLYITNYPNLTYLNVKNNPSLTTLYCYGNKLSSLYVTGCSALKDLRCYGSNNTFWSLDLSGTTALTYLDCGPCPNLSTIYSLADCKNMKTLICYESKLGTMNPASFMTYLEKLDCHSTKIEALNLSDKSKLTSVNCSSCPQLTTATLNNNMAMTTLNCSSNTALTTLASNSNPALTSLNVTGNTALTILQCLDDTRLSAITGLSGCTSLKTFNCSSCALTDFSVLSNLNNLETLVCSDNKMTSLSISGKSKLKTLDCSYNPQMTSLYCYSNALTSLNVTNNTGLSTLSCYSNASLSSITGLASCTNLTTLSCYSCNFSSLSLSALTKLQKLECYSNKLTSLALSNLTSLKQLYCQNNQLTSLTLPSSSTALQTVNCSNNKFTTLSINGYSNLTTLNVSNNTSMTTLNCYNNKLSSFTVTGCSALTTLNCYGSNHTYTTLNLTGTTKLTALDCHSNASLSSITALGSCTAMKTLKCYSTALTSLDVANMSNLETLQCYSTKLTSLSLTNKTKLATLSCYNIPTMTTLTVTGAPLTSLSMTGNTGLTTLNCYSNSNLTGITNLSACTNLVTLNCYSNNFTTLDVPSLTKLQTLKCYNNKLTSLKVQGCTALKTIECYKNKITGTGMTTLVNSLPTRTSSAKGTLRAIYNSGESNTMTAAQITTARNKYWTPYKYNGSSWVEMTSIVDKIWMDNATGDPGVYVNLPVTLQNSETVQSIEFDVYYPTGFTALASKGPRLAEGSTVANSTTSGYRHVTIANTSTNVVVEEAGSGVICYVRVKAPATAGGSYEISLRNIKVVLASGTKTLSNCTATFTVNNTTGDVNGDGNVNIGDVTDLIDYLMSGNASGINVAAADVNGDGGVNITDVTDLIDLLLTK